MADFYVNTASTPGGNGSTNGTAGADRAFASLREAITSNELDIAAPRIIHCSGTAADTENVVQTHWDSVDTTPTNYIEIIGNNPTPGIYNTSAYRLEVSGANVIYNNKPGHVRIDNLQIKLSSGSGLTAYRLSTQNVGVGRTDNDCRISRCIAWCPDGGNATYNSNYAEGPSPANGLIRIYNCISIGGLFGAANAGVENYNNTVYGASSGFLDPQIIVNCIAVGSSGNDFESVGTGGGVSNYNVSEDGTAPGANSVTGVPDFVNPGVDLHLELTDTVALGNGVTDPASGLFDDDIDGLVRTVPWSIGASQPYDGSVILETTNLNVTTLTVG